MQRHFANVTLTNTQYVPKRIVVTHSKLALSVPNALNVVTLINPPYVPRIVSSKPSRLSQDLIDTRERRRAMRDDDSGAAHARRRRRAGGPHWNSMAAVAAVVVVLALHPVAQLDAVRRAQLIDEPSGEQGVGQETCQDIAAHRAPNCMKECALPTLAATKSKPCQGIPCSQQISAIDIVRENRVM